MRFGPVPLDRALGAVLAHSLHLPGRRLRKGAALEPADLADLAAAGLSEVTVARLDPGDVAEDAAAADLARALVPDPAAAHLEIAAPFTGRANLHATAAGVLELQVAAIDALNRVDPAITLATLPPFARVAPGLLVATVKIIAYGVAGDRLAAACDAARGALAVRPVALRRAGLVQTVVTGQNPQLNDKGRRAVAARLATLGIDLVEEREVAHGVAPLAAALGGMSAELLLVLTGSATSDLHDTAPEALRRAGGRIERFGLPVDPGNLLFLGWLDGRAVIGLPGSARSPVPHGADWVLERVACGLPLGAEEFARMGVGGLLKEIPSRPQPRERRRPGLTDP